MNIIKITSSSGSAWVNLDRVNIITVSRPTSTAWFHIYVDGVQLPLKFISEDAAQNAIGMAMKEVK